MIQTISITISGQVQGVFYRQSTKEKAQVLGITGMVKNLPNGKVHILATGTDEQLEQLLAWCKQGPPNAQVNKVKVDYMANKTFEGFEIN